MLKSLNKVDSSLMIISDEEEITIVLSLKIFSALEPISELEKTPEKPPTK